MPVTAAVVPGQDAYLQSVSSIDGRAVFFEGDGRTGYFYALEDHPGEGHRVADAVAIYTVSEGDQLIAPVTVSLCWSSDGSVAGLSLNGTWQAVFDFRNRRGSCRQDFPEPGPTWTRLMWADQSTKLLLDALRI